VLGTLCDEALALIPALNVSITVLVVLNGWMATGKGMVAGLLSGVCLDIVFFHLQEHCSARATRAKDMLPHASTIVKRLVGSDSAYRRI
jgi:hypothetical protein